MVEKLHEQSLITPEFDILHVLKNCSMDMICGKCHKDTYPI